MPPVNFFFAGWEPVGRVLVVASLGYVALVLLLRVSGKRTLSRLNMFDFVITVALGATFGRVLTASSVALAEVVTAFAALIGLQFAVAWLKVRSTRFARVVTAAPVLLYFRGEYVDRALRAERVTREEVEATARLHGVGSLSEVEAVVLESNGRFAVVKASSAGDGSALGPVRGA